MYTVRYTVNYDGRSNLNKVIFPNRLFTKTVEYPIPATAYDSIPVHDITKMLKTNSVANNTVRDWPAWVYVDKQSFVKKTVWGNERLSETTIFQFDLTPTVLHVHYIHCSTPSVNLLLSERWLCDQFPVLVLNIKDDRGSYIFLCFNCSMVGPLGKVTVYKVGSLMKLSFRPSNFYKMSICIHFKKKKCNIQ